MGTLEPEAFFIKEGAVGAVEEDFVETVVSVLMILRLTGLVAFLPPYESSSSLSSLSLSSWSSSSSLAARFLEVTEVLTVVVVEDISTLVSFSAEETRAEGLVVVERFVTMAGVINLDRGKCGVKFKMNEVGLVAVGVEERPRRPKMTK